MNIKTTWSKYFLSFIYDVPVEKRRGEISPFLEVVKHHGKLLLNTRTVNYSFGGLHHIFMQLLREIHLENYRFKNVLILGMGAGSIVDLLRNTYHFNCQITAVEADEVVIELARKYFDIESYPSLNIVHDDAFHFVETDQEHYDLIITDLFIDENVPKKFATEDYLLNLKRLSTPESCIIYNKMTEEPRHKQELEELFPGFAGIFPNAQVHTLYAGHCENSLLYFNSFAC